MLIDCDRCMVRGLACGDCVVSALLGGPPPDVAVEYGPAEWLQVDRVHVDAVEVAALDALAAGGLVPPLRLVLPDTGTG